MEKSKAKQIYAVTCIGFLAFGLLYASIGPLLSQFATRNGTDLATIGGIYSAVFLGSVVSQLFLGRFTDHWGQLQSLTISLLTLGLGFTFVSFSSWLPLTFVLSFVSGIGLGLSNLCGNVLASQIFKENSVSSVNLLNVFWGIGAFVGPLMVSGSFYLWQTGFPTLYFGTSLAVIAALLLLFCFFKIRIGPQRQPGETHSSKRIHYTAFLWSLGGFLLIYVGSEGAMGGWATTYIQETTSVKIELAALVTAAFWLAITLGRLMGAILGSRLAPQKVLMICLSLASLGAVLFVAGFGHSVMSITAIFLAGLGFGAIFPTSIAIATQAFPETPGQAGAVIAVMASMGGMFIPWLQGAIMQQAGIRAGTYMFAVLIVLLLISFGVNRRFSKTA